jgi:hypothetical protein
MPEVACPLCRNADPARLDAGFHRDKKRTYTECADCGMVFVPPAEHVTVAEEKARYDTHINDCEDDGYRRFLGRTATPLLALIARSIVGAPVDGDIDFDAPENQQIVAAASDAVRDAAGPAAASSSSQESPAPWRGLDYGCGPGPTLCLLLEASPLIAAPVALYDLYYRDDRTVLHDEERRPRKYDFVTSTEVVEHLAQCGDVLDLLWDLVRPNGGILAIMTKRVTSKQAFAKWHYKNDPTHISFFHERSFREYLARRFRPRAMHFYAADVVLFVKA